jgi:hypothetical protein
VNGMTAITESEGSEQFEAILDAVSQGAVFEVMRDGRHMATIEPPSAPEPKTDRPRNDLAKSGPHC